MVTVVVLVVPSGAMTVSVAEFPLVAEGLEGLCAATTAGMASAASDSRMKGFIAGSFDGVRGLRTSDINTIRRVPGQRQPAGPSVTGAASRAPSARLPL